jgi:hypothetical protein
MGGCAGHFLKAGKMMPVEFRGEFVRENLRTEPNSAATHQNCDPHIERAMWTNFLSERCKLLPHRDRSLPGDRVEFTSTPVDRGIATSVFAVLWITIVYFGPGLSLDNANEVTRMGLTFSILQDASLRIDRFAPYTIDTAVYGGHVYSDKAPGQSLVATPFVGALMFATHTAGYSTAPIENGHLTNFFRYAIWVGTAFTSALFTALAAGCLYLLARMLGAGQPAAQEWLISLSLFGAPYGWLTQHTPAPCNAHIPTGTRTRWRHGPSRYNRRADRGPRALVDRFVDR